MPFLPLNPLKGTLSTTNKNVVTKRRHREILILKGSHINSPGCNPGKNGEILPTLKGSNKNLSLV